MAMTTKPNALVLALTLAALASIGMAAIVKAYAAVGEIEIGFQYRDLKFNTLNGTILKAGYGGWYPDALYEAIKHYVCTDPRYQCTILTQPA